MASGSIKGITIEILGKTDGLVKSLGAVNKSLAETQKSLNTVNKALKLDPKNVETLKTKQELLSNAIKQTEEKLKLEKQAAEEAAKALEEGTITKAQYDTMNAEIAKTTSELKDLKSQAETTDKAIKDLGGSNKMASFTDALDKAQSKLKSVGDQLTDVGEKLTKTASAAVAGFGTASIAAYKSVDDGLDSIVKKTGATGEALEEMEDIAKDIATTIPTSFDIAGNAVGDVATMFNVTGDELEELSTQFIKFADITDSDVSSSIDGVQKIMEAYNIKGKDATKVLDSLASASQRYGVSTDTLDSALVSNQATFKELNMNLPTSIDFLGKLERSGIDSSTMLSGLSKALKNSTKDGKTLNEGLADLQNSLKNAASDTEGLQLANELFGKSGATIYEQIKEGKINLDNLAGSTRQLSDDLGTVTRTYDDMTDGSDEMTMAVNSAKLALAEVGKTLSETLAPIIKKVADKLKDFAKWWKNLSPEIKNVILKVGALIAVLGPVLIFIGKVSTGISALIGVFTACSTFITGTMIPALTGLNGGLAATLAPIAAVVLAITAIIMVIKNWDDIVEVAKELWQGFCDFMLSIINAIGDAWNDFVDMLSGLIEEFVNFWSEAWESIKQFFSDIWESIKQIASDAWNAITGFFAGIGQWFSDRFTEAYNAITGIFGKLGDFFKGVWDTIVGIFTEVGTAVGDAVGGAVKNVINSVLSGAIGIINGFISLINGAIKIINKIPGVSIPKIKKLDVVQMEQGGVLKKGQIGFLEGNGAEAVVPLDKNKKWIDAVAQSMKSSLAMTQPQIDYRPQLNQIISAMENGATITINQTMNGQAFDRQVIAAINRYNYRTGGR